MSLSIHSTQQVTISSQKSISGTQKLRRVASKILQKMKFPKGKDDNNLEGLDSTEVQVARFVTFVRQTEAPQIIDLKAIRRNIRPQPARIYTHCSSGPRSQEDLNSPEFRLQESFENPHSPTETGTPLRRNPQQVFVFGATSDRSAAAVLDDVAYHMGYKMLDDEDYDVDWSLLELPENVYGRLANESTHSLI